MNKSQIFKLAHRLNDTVNSLNKYIYIIPIISAIINLLSRFYNNKVFSMLKFVIQLLTTLTILLSVGAVIYFIDLSTPIHQTFSIYKDLLEPYMELIKGIWDKIVNYFSNLIQSESQIKSDIESIVKETTSQIKGEVKTGMREAIQEALNEMPEDNNSTPYLKYLALISSGLFFIYFLFVLPGTSITTEEFLNYHWINQSLIEFKITIKDLIIAYLNGGNPGNPDNPGASDITSSTNTPTTELNRLFPIESNNSGSSDGGCSTITPNTPRVSTLSSLTKSDASTETVLNSVSVSKMVEMANIIQDVLPEEGQKEILKGVDRLVKKITD